MIEVYIPLITTGIVAIIGALYAGYIKILKLRIKLNIELFEKIKKELKNGLIKIIHDELKKHIKDCQENQCNCKKKKEKKTIFWSKRS